MFNKEDKTTLNSLPAKLGVLTDLLSSITTSVKVVEQLNVASPKDINKLEDDIKFITEAIYGRFNIIEGKLNKLNDKLYELDKLDGLIEKVDKVILIKDKVDSLETLVDKKLIKFRQEFMDKYFDNLNAFIRWNKELVLISSLMDNKSPDVDNLKKDLIAPYIKEKNELTKISTSENINQILNSKGNAIRLRRVRLYEDYLKADREERPQPEIDILKAKVDTLDEIIGDNL